MSDGIGKENRHLKISYKKIYLKNYFVNLSTGSIIVAFF